MSTAVGDSLFPLMRKLIFAISLLTLAALNAIASDAPDSRAFEATYTATIANIPADAGVITVWLPLPRARSAQGINDVKIDSPYNWQRYTEKEFGNDYAVAKIPAPPTGELVLRVKFR